MVWHRWLLAADRVRVDVDVSAGGEGSGGALGAREDERTACLAAVLVVPVLGGTGNRREHRPLLRSHRPPP